MLARVLKSPYHGGHLEVIVGPMFSGKSEELIRRLTRAVIARQNVQVFKPALDDRYHESAVASHAGRSVHAVAVRGAAELRGLEDIMAQTGEAAFSVERDWRRRGIGGTLFGRLITAARNRSIRTLYMTCLPENAAMRRLARKFEADLAGGYADVEGVIATGGPTPFTILDEALDTARGFAAMALSFQRRFWRPALFGRSAGA